MLKEHKGYEGNIYVDYFEETIMEFPEKNAITCVTNNRTFTYGEMGKITNKLDHKFRQAGLKKNDVVMVCLLNTWQLPMMMIASWKTPCIFSPINFRLAAGEIAVHIDDSKPTVFLWDSSLDVTIKKALELAAYKPNVLLCTAQSEVKGAMSFEDYYKDAPVEDPDMEERVMEILDPMQDEILRHYTSGTTGAPKGTVETSLALMHMDWSVIATDHINWCDVATNITPWFHQGGLLLCTTVLVSGGHLIGLSLTKATGDSTLDLVEKYKITLIWGAPVTFDGVAAAQRAKKRDISSLRLIHTMGSPFSRKQFKEWQEVITPNIANTYGTTETRQDLVLHSNIHSMAEKAGSAGRRAPLCRVRVVQIRPGEKVEPREMVPKDGQTEGQVISKSPHQYLGYYKRPNDDAKRNYKGWVYTGDVATWDEDGFVTIRGRTDDMITSGAEKVYPVPVEECIMRNSKVADVSVIGIPHEKWGQAVSAYVVPKEGVQLTVAELDEHCRKDPYLANYTRPRYYQIVDGPLPYTATGKKIHYALVKKAKDELDKFVPIPSEKK